MNYTTFRDVPGPWHGEPDREEFRHAGLPCLVNRGPLGAWCGYVAVPPGHPLHGVKYGDPHPLLGALWERRKEAPVGTMGSVEVLLAAWREKNGEGQTPAAVFDVHGSLTYSGKCQGEICHVPQQGESDDVWWFGFDCGHAGDITPATVAAFPDREVLGDVYRDLAYVKAETCRLADQLAGVVL